MAMRQVLVAVVFLVFSAGVARGADLDSARDHYAKGTRAYDLGLYDEAIAEYMTAYKIKDDPALLFNIGQAHRLAGHPTEALRFYKTYLSKIPAATNRAEVEAKMLELTRQLEQQKQSAPQAHPAPAAESPAAIAPSTEASPASAPPSAAPIVTPTPAAVAEAAPGETPRSGRALRLGGIASAAGGLALVGTGIVFGVLAKRAGDDLTQLDEQRGIFDPAKEDAGQRNQLLSGVFIGVGAAAVATGVVLYVLGARGGEPTSQAFVISPSVAPHAAGATLRMVY
jgi:tetratricopeptide (TPR) repeat protein